MGCAGGRGFCRFLRVVRRFAVTIFCGRGTGGGLTGGVQHRCFFRCGLLGRLGGSCLLRDSSCRGLRFSRRGGLRRGLCLTGSPRLYTAFNGLIPAIVQDHYTKEVLTLAYMNAETLALTIAEGRTVFWSRSRQEIWRKGETSGNVQRVVSITADCDKDALVVDVIKSGPACHTGAESCFFNPVYVSDELKQFTWQGLYELIEGRKTNPKEGSYTTYLFDKDLEKILKKVGEESFDIYNLIVYFHLILFPSCTAKAKPAYCLIRYI